MHPERQENSMMARRFQGQLHSAFDGPPSALGATLRALRPRVYLCYRVTCKLAVGQRAARLSKLPDARLHRFGAGASIA
jgi:hypothetical protein